MTRNPTLAAELLPLIPGQWYRLRNGKLARLDTMITILGESEYEGKVRGIPEKESFFLWFADGRFAAMPDPAYDIVDKIGPAPL